MLTTIQEVLLAEMQEASLFAVLKFITLVDLEAAVLLMTKAGCVFQILPVEKVKRL